MGDAALGGSDRMTREALPPPKVGSTSKEGESDYPWTSGGIKLTCGGERADQAPILDSIDKFTQNTSDAPIREQAPASWPTPQQRKRKRLFFYLKSGLMWNNSREIRFLTLTSAPGSPDLARSFNRLVTEIRRTTPESLVKGGWLTLNDLEVYYPGVPVDEPLQFEYAGCRTDEGYGVLHLLVCGGYLPVRWLRSLWVKIHGARQINIQKVGDRDRVAGYVLGQYVGNQSKFIRMHVSRRWLFPGARKVFLELIRRRKADLGGVVGFKAALGDWNAYLITRRSPAAVLAGEDADVSVKEHRRDHHVRRSGRFRSPRAPVASSVCGVWGYPVVPGPPDRLDHPHARG